MADICSSHLRLVSMPSSWYSPALLKRDLSAAKTCSARVQRAPVAAWQKITSRLSCRDVSGGEDTQSSDRHTALLSRAKLPSRPSYLQFSHCWTKFVDHRRQREEFQFHMIKIHFKFITAQKHRSLFSKQFQEKHLKNLLCFHNLDLFPNGRVNSTCALEQSQQELVLPICGGSKGPDEWKAAMTVNLHVWLESVHAPSTILWRLSTRALMEVGRFHGSSWIFLWMSQRQRRVQSSVWRNSVTILKIVSVSSNY